MDIFIESIKKGDRNPYDVLSEFAAFLTLERPAKVSNLTVNFIAVIYD
jgi:hypothetical protein